MTDYPEDVMQAARECAAVVPDFFHIWEDEPQFEADKAAEDIAKIIARAITADRKRRVHADREKIARAIAADLGRQECDDPLPLDANLCVDWIDQGQTDMGQVADAVIAALDFTDEPGPRLAAAEADAERLAEALRELMEIVDFMVEGGEYEPDSFTCQPARAALAAHEARNRTEGGE